LDAAYLNQHIIGLVSTHYVSNTSACETKTVYSYDADRLLIEKNSQEFTFDASGQMVRMNNPLQRINANGYGLTLTYGYDGDGQKVKETKYSAYYYPQTTSTYYLHSSVLGGHVIRELTGIGVAGIGYVYMGDSLLMRGSEWVHENPVTGSQRRTQDTGAIRAAGSVELDPLGNDVGMSDPYIGAQQDTDQPYPRFGEPVNQFGGCSVDGVPAPCGYVAGLLNNGNAALCPNGDCGAHGVEDRNGGWHLAPPALYTHQGVGYRRWVPSKPHTQIEHPADNDYVAYIDTDEKGGHYEWVNEPAGIVFAEGLQRSTSQNPTQFKDQYIRCAEAAGGPVPPRSAVTVIQTVSQMEGIDPTVLAVTWGAEASPPFSFDSVGHPRYKNGKAIGADVGPGQIANNGPFTKSPWTDGLGDPFGTFTTQRVPFDGNPLDNLRLSARILKSDGGGRTSPVPPRPCRPIFSPALFSSHASLLFLQWFASPSGRSGSIASPATSA
jgi:hypothetical protein